MRGEGEGAEAALGHIDAELFLELAHQRALRCLARMHLAAGELPEPGHRPALGPARDQHAPIRIDQRHRGDENDAALARHARRKREKQEARRRGEERI
jgi:hypothetical protein